MYIKLKAPIKVHEIGNPGPIHTISTRDNIKIHTPFYEEYVVLSTKGQQFVLYFDQINPRSQDLTKWSLLLARLKLSLI